eukprot:1578096-Amphidinium_carterae.1
MENVAAKDCFVYLPLCGFIRLRLSCHEHEAQCIEGVTVATNRKTTGTFTYGARNASQVK